jgi:hypothetical protein
MTLTMSLLGAFAIAVVAGGFLVAKRLVPARSAKAPKHLTSRKSMETAEQVVARVFPESGLLVQGEVSNEAEWSASTLADALTHAAIPIAFAYRPLAPSERSKLRTVRVNASAQKGITQLVELVGPKAPTLFRAVLPASSELARAAGGGFRGFAQGQGGRITAQAVLKPVGLGAAAAVSWPVLAVAATVMALDAVAQKEQRQHQRRLESVLHKQEARHYRQRSARQSAVDLELSEAISLMLDGQNVDGQWEHSRLAAFEELEESRRYVGEHAARARAVIKDGVADYGRLSSALGSAEKAADEFYLESEFARGALGLARKAALASAAASALRDPTNPYVALRTVLAARLELVTAVEREFDSFSNELTQVELSHGFWSFSGPAKRMKDLLVDEMSPRAPLDGEAIEFLALPSGEMYQVVGRTEAEPEGDASGAPSP